MFIQGTSSKIKLGRRGIRGVTGAGSLGKMCGPRLEYLMVTPLFGRPCHLDFYSSRYLYFDILTTATGDL